MPHEGDTRQFDGAVTPDTKPSRMIVGEYHIDAPGSRVPLMVARVCHEDPAMSVWPEIVGNRVIRVTTDQNSFHAYSQFQKNWPLPRALGKAHDPQEVSYVRGTLEAHRLALLEDVVEIKTLLSGYAPYLQQRTLATYLRTAITRYRLEESGGENSVVFENIGHRQALSDLERELQALKLRGATPLGSQPHDIGEMEDLLHRELQAFKRSRKAA